MLFEKISRKINEYKLSPDHSKKRKQDFNTDQQAIVPFIIQVKEHAR